MEARLLTNEENTVTEDSAKKSSLLVIEQFLLEYELLQLLEQTNFTPSIIKVDEVIPPEASIDYPTDTDLTAKIAEVKQKIINIQVLMKLSIQALNLDDIHFVHNELTKRCNLMLKVACIQKNAALRDAAIKIGAQHKFLLMESMNLLLLSYKNPDRLTPIEEYDPINYDKIIFLLNTKLHINILEVIGIAQEIGPKMLIPIFEYLTYQPNGLTYLMIKTYLEHHLVRYMKDYTINILLERNVPHVFNACMSILNCTEIEFFASVGDEERLKEIIQSMNLKDGNTDQISGTKALIKACAYGRENTAKILIDAGADVNATLLTSGVILHAAIKKRQIEIIQLLLSSSEIEISFKPFPNKPNIYDYAISSSFEIKKLFEGKKREIDNQINEFSGKIIGKISNLRDQAQKLFAGIGCGEKAASLQQALNNALTAQPSCFSVYQFLHVKLQDEPSIFEALEKIRIWSKPDNDDLIKAIKVPVSYMRPH